MSFPFQVFIGQVKDLLQTRISAEIGKHTEQRLKGGGLPIVGIGRVLGMLKMLGIGGTAAKLGLVLRQDIGKRRKH